MCRDVQIDFSWRNYGHDRSDSDYISQLVEAIQALRAVRNVTITYNSGSTVCGDTAVVASVTFTHNAGNLPPMIATSSLTTTVLLPVFPLAQLPMEHGIGKNVHIVVFAILAQENVTVSLDGPAATVVWVATWHLVNVAIAP